MSHEDFQSLYSLVAPYTLLSFERLSGLYAAIKIVEDNKIPGEVVECGVAKGGSSALMGLTLKSLGSQRHLFACDTFEGMPIPTGDDPVEAQQHVGQNKGSTEEVEALFNALGIQENIRLVKGLFQDTLSGLKVEKIAVLHLDGDWYESTKCGLNELYDRVSPGGFIQIDDYGHWTGCRQAVDEFFVARRIRPEWDWLDYTGVQFRKGVA